MIVIGPVGTDARWGEKKLAGFTKSARSRESEGCEAINFHESRLWSGGEVNVEPAPG